jgi:hypothetical protein
MMHQVQKKKVNLLHLLVSSISSSDVISNPELQDTVSVSPPSLTGYCQNGACSSWNILDTNFSFPVPKDYPRRYDTSKEAPQPPIGRHIFDSINQNIQNLHTVRLTLEWLEKAALFAHHQMSTKPPGGKKIRDIGQREAV